LLSSPRPEENFVCVAFFMVKNASGSHIITPWKPKKNSVHAEDMINDLGLGIALSHLPSLSLSWELIFKDPNSIDHRCEEGRFPKLRENFEP
jgi:hypothetical protein